MSAEIESTNLKLPIKSFKLNKAVGIDLEIIGCD